jgi:methylmalonyl-CoA/ethylmalonyl-CoA epimerase
MLKRVDHIAFAVRNLAESRKKIEDLYGARFIVEQVNPEGKYKVAIFRVGESLFSMLESTTPEGFIAKHIERCGEGVQHMGMEVEDLQEFIARLHSQGVKTSGYTEIEGVRREVLVGAGNGFGVVFQVFEWLGDYKKASPEERMTKVWG